MSDRVTLSVDQADALSRVLDWYGSGDTQLLTLGGYAGTGKTTLIRELIERIGAPNVAVCAYTGKAAHVLRTKGIENAKTIHSTIYMPQTLCKFCRAQLAGKDDTCTRFERCLRAGTEDTFALVPALGQELVIVDEASMVSSEIHRDLLSFDVPVLYVGDHGQLPPIGDNPGLMLDPMVRLEQIHRQAEGSPILRFAHHVRQHGYPETTGTAARVVLTTTVPHDAHKYDIVLCGKNSTRIAVNAKIRRALGYTGALPQPGERVVCLRNSREYNIFNGMLATVIAIRADDRVDVPELDIVDDEGIVRNGIKIVPEQFGCEEKLDGSSFRRGLFDFGYALTTHKSQGSEWKRVLVLEWIHRDTSAARWRYTAATRASEELVWCMRPRGEMVF